MSDLPYEYAQSYGQNAIRVYLSRSLSLVDASTVDYTPGLIADYDFTNQRFGSPVFKFINQPVANMTDILVGGGGSGGGGSGGGPGTPQTPELDSFTLFLVGAIGVGSYWWYQRRKARTA